MDENQPKGEEPAPELESFFEAIPNPKDVRALIEKELKEGKLDIQNLRERIHTIIKSRAFYSGGKDDNLDSAADLLEKSLDYFSNAYNDAVSFWSDSMLYFTGNKKEENKE